MTSYVEAGGPGIGTLDEFLALLEGRTKTTLYAGPYIRPLEILGLNFIESNVRTLTNIPIADWLDFHKAHPGLLRGVKVGAFSGYGYGPNKIGKGLAEILDLPLYAHIGEHQLQPGNKLAYEIYRVSEAGDIVTHVYHGNECGILDKDGKISAGRAGGQEPGCAVRRGLRWLQFFMARGRARLGTRELLAAARRPLVWAGGGAARDGAGPAVAALAERLGAPVLTTYQAAGLLDGHPLALGMPPHLPETGALWDAADVVVAVGSDLDGVTTQNWRQPQPPALVAVNVDPADAAKNYRVDAVVAATAAAGVAALADVDGDGAREPWADVAAVRAAVRERLRGEHPAELAFLDAFASAVPRDAVVVCDMCIPGYWLGAFHPVSAPGRMVYPLGWGTLGCAFPQAIGSALADRGPTVSVSGDGGFLYACGELATIAQERVRSPR